ncbi:MAG: hypothetical protein O3A51_02605 [Verrucomicrobia bacterium]|nr:hypothetical protein [Verrucomicrobiota bacterium]
MLGKLGALWGVGGVCLLLFSAIFRLGRMAIDTFAQPLFWWHWLAIVLFVPYMIWSEGACGFQRSFSPRVAARARHLRDHPRRLHVLLAPLFCMGYFHIARRRQVMVFGLTAAIVTLIVLVRHLVQPWRGIVDIGVVGGLLWGVTTVIIFATRALTAETFSHSAELPEDWQPSSR